MEQLSWICDQSKGYFFLTVRNCWSRLFLRETQDAANNQVGSLTLIFTYSPDPDAGAA